MVCRFLEKKVRVRMQEIYGESGNKMELEYYLVEHDESDFNNTADGSEYGIEIVENGPDRVKESSLFENIYPSREKTAELVKKLADHVVTPVSLAYILDDILGI